jgi:hypothetical protein
MAETSVVVRSFNEDEYVGDALRAVREQAYDDLEIVLVDSGSTDDTLEIARPLVDEVATLEPRDFTFGYSLNVGCEAASGEYVAFLSAHAVPTDEHWLGRMVRHFADPEVAMVYSNQTGVESTAFPEQRHFDELFGEERAFKEPPEYFANNASSVIRAELWEEYPFDEHLTGCEDMDWAKHFMDRGYRLVYEPDACIYHIHEESPTQVFTRFEREAIAQRDIGVRNPRERFAEYARLPRDVLADAAAAATSGEFDLDTLREVLAFRYNQRMGTAAGLADGGSLETDRYEFFYGGANRCVVVSGPEESAVTERPLPEIRPSDALVEVSYAGVRPGDSVGSYPFVPGREFVGSVVDAGANVEDIAVGDTVAGTAASGAYARFLAVPAERAVPLPAGMDPETAVAAPALATVLDGLESVRAAAGDPERTAVLGADAFGLLCAGALGADATVFDPSGVSRESLPADAGFEGRFTHPSDFDLLVETPAARERGARPFADAPPGAAVLALGDGPEAFDGGRPAPGGRTLVEAGAPTADALERALDALPSMPELVNRTYPLTEYRRAWGDLTAGETLKPALAPGSE